MLLRMRALPARRRLMKTRSTILVLPAILLSANLAAADPGPQIVPTKSIRTAYSGSLIQDGPEVFEADMKYDTTTTGAFDTFAESYAYGDSQDVEGTSSH